MEPKVSIILLNLNVWEDTVECLESLFQIDYTNYNVVLVDNHSDDDSIEKIKEYSKGGIQVRSEFYDYNLDNKPLTIVNALESTSTTDNNSIILIENDENYGFAIGNNVGIEYAMKTLKPDYILLLNNDTVVDKYFLDELIKVGESSQDIGFIGPKTLFYDEEDVIQEAGGGDVDYKHCKVEEIGFKEVDDGTLDFYIEPDYIGGACLLVKQEVVDKIGPLDPKYFMYWEDVDWCITGRENGYKCAYAYKSRIWHKYGSSSENYFKMYYLNRNRLYFMRKHTTRLEYMRFLSYFIPYILFESIYQLLRKRDVHMSRSFFMGMVNGFRIASPSRKKS
jgi:GT2 family glycosyltransferase